MMGYEVCLRSDRMDWETPQDLFDELDSEFHFTLDACASHKNAKVDRYFTINDDGLKQKWDGVVWCNPPYGRTLGKWVKKAYEEYLAGSTVVMLIPARTDTSYFHDYIWGVAEVRFIRGRLRFVGATENAPFPSMVVIYRRKIDEV